jgi:hypothetical protein
MACFNHATIVDLAARETLSLPDFRGTTLRVTRGTLWITQQDDTQDVVLRAGDNWVVERNGLTLVEAQNDATFCAIGGDFARMPVRGVTAAAVTPWWTRVADGAARFFATPARNAAPYF